MITSFHLVNASKGVRAIVEHSNVEDVKSPWHTQNLARKISCPTLLVAGAEDRIAPPEQVYDLQKQILQNNQQVCATTTTNSRVEWVLLCFC